MREHSWLPDFFGRDRKADPIQSLRSEIERVFEDFPRSWAAAPGRLGAIAPTLDISESENALRVRVELPGVEEADVDVTFANDVLTIKGEKKLQREETGETFHRSERSHGLFQRSIATPPGLDPSAVTAAMKDGVLEITMPKPPEAASAARKISISKA